jgi:mannose-6-phosphate isomerase-like protein (cupin superfamily)
MTENRPWGFFYNLEKSDNYLVKKIVINAGQSISLQYHNHREEHWVIVKGCPTITIDNKTKEYTTGLSVFIPKKSIHRIENKSEGQVVIIEVQIGELLSEDDIVRLKDIYDRK